jgi:hypothetical protein
LAASASATTACTKHSDNRCRVGDLLRHLRSVSADIGIVCDVEVIGSRVHIYAGVPIAPQRFAEIEQRSTDPIGGTPGEFFDLICPDSEK